jgi:cytosine/adenosine deaminase-related metal-dependent hydrolase
MPEPGGGTRRTARLVLRGLRWPGDIAIVGDRITEVGTVPPNPGDEVLRFDGDIATAGLVNTHHHLYQWMTRGRATSSGLFDWLVELYPVWARLDPADVHAAAAVGLAELACSGATTVADHHYVVPGGDDSVFDAVADAARAVGVRLHLSRGSMDLGERDGGLPPDSLVEETDAILASTEAVARRLHDGERCFVNVAPCSPFSVSRRLLSESATLARRLGLRLHTHLAETVDEERDCLERFGCRPLELLADLGWLGDDVWFAHGIHFDDAEVRRLGETGTGVAHCPSSNGRLGSGTCRVRDLLDAGAPVGLGVDGVASNEAGRLFGELRQALYLARLGARRAEALMPSDALWLGTVGGARCLGLEGAGFGKLEPGAPADLVVWPGEDLADVPDAIAGLVLGPDRSARHVLVGGETVVSDGQPTGVDLAEAHRALARRCQRAGSARQ